MFFQNKCPICNIPNSTWKRNDFCPCCNKKNNCSISNERLIQWELGDVLQLDENHFEADSDLMTFRCKRIIEMVCKELNISIPKYEEYIGNETGLNVMRFYANQFQNIDTIFI